MDVVPLYVPCNEFDVSVVIGPRGGLTAIELICLRAIRAGVQTLDDLVSLLGLGYRPTLDLLFGLWKVGDVMVDVGRERVALSEQAERAFADDATANLRSGALVEESLTLMQDCLLGRVHPVAGRRSSPSANRTIPCENRRLELDRLSKQEIADAAQAVWNHRLRRDDREIRKVRVATSALRTRTSGRWVELNVRAFVNGDSDDLAIQIVDAKGVPAALFGEFERKIAQLAVDQRDHFVVRMLRGTAVARTTERSALELVDALAARVARLGKLPTGTLRSHHENLKELARDAAAAVRGFVGVPAGIEAVVGNEAHEQFVKEALRRAVKQVVLVCSWVQHDPLNRTYWGDLTDALHRGVRVYLLWGVENGKLDGSVRNALQALAAQYPGFVFSTKPARTHAKIVVQDDRVALITSCNYLDPSKSGALEVGIAVSAQEADSPVPIVLDVLAWAHSVFPEHQRRAGLRSTLEEFAEPTGGIAPSMEVRRTSESSSVEVPEPPSFDATHNDLAAVSRTIWEANWRVYVAALRAQLVPRGFRVRVVTNRDHSDFMWHALRSAKSCIVIASDRLNEDVVQDKFAHCLEGRLAAGVRVAIIARRPKEQPKQMLEQLRQRFPELLLLKHGEQSHAKLLICDDAVIVTSFNFLSFVGYYVEGPDGKKSRDRSEVGVLLHGNDGVECVLASLPERWSDVVAFVRSAAAYTAPVVDADTIILSVRNALQNMIADAAGLESEGARFDAYAEWFHTAKTPYEDLEYLRDTGLSAHELRLAAAACIAEDEHFDGSEGPWMRWLAVEAWSRGDVHEAFVFAAKADAWPNEMPSRWLTQLVALERDWGLCEPLVITHALQGDLSDVDADCLALAMLRALLVDGHDAASGVLRDLQPQIEPTLGECVAAALEYWNAINAPLPMAELERRAGLRAQDEAADRALLALGDVFTEVAGYHFKFGTGQKTWEHLFRPSGAFGKLRPYIQRKNLDGVRTWLTDDVPSNDDIGEIMDEATRAMTGGGGFIGQQEGTANARRNAIERLKSVRKAAAHWVALAGEKDTRTDAIVDRALALGAALVNPVAELQARLQRDQIAVATRPIVKRLLRTLAPLVGP